MSIRQVGARSEGMKHNRGEAAILDGLVEGDFPEDMTFEQRPE